MSDLNKIINEQRERIEKLESENIRLYNALAKFEGVDQEISSLKHESNMKSQRIENVQRRKLEYKQRTEAAEKRRAEIQQLIAEQCALHHTTFDYKNTRSTLMMLLDTNSKWSLDPKISSGAAEFAIEQQIKALEKFEHISVAVANHWCDKEQAGYLWFHSEVISELKRLRQKLNTSDH